MNMNVAIFDNYDQELQLQSATINNFYNNIYGLEILNENMSPVSLILPRAWAWPPMCLS